MQPADGALWLPVAIAGQRRGASDGSPVESGRHVAERVPLQCEVGAIRDATSDVDAAAHPARSTRR